MQKPMNVTRSYKQVEKLNHMIISINTKESNGEKTIFSSKTIQLKQLDTYTQNIKSRYISYILHENELKNESET